MVKKISYMGEKNSSNLVRKIDSYLIGFYRIFPFTAHGIVRYAFGKFLKTKRKVTLLDIGCGDGSATYDFNFPNNFEITGVDIFQPYLDLAKDRGIYKKLIRADVRKFNPKEKFDIVMANHILEHFDKLEGKTFLKKAENMAKEKVIMVTPIGEYPQEIYDENIHQEHKSSWQIDEMKKLGYKVKSRGLKFLYQNKNVVQKYGLFSYILFTISALLSPLLSFKPEWGTYMICVKDKNIE